MPKAVVGLLRWVVALALPIFLILTVARFTIADWFPRYEYARPDFPLDRYGWAQQQRLELLLPTFHFLNSPLPAEQAIDILAAQRYPDSNVSLFTRNELQHMIDVKRLIDGLWRSELIAGLLASVGIALLLFRRGSRPSAYLALSMGGILTVVFLLALAFFMAVGFDMAFVLFHEIFFPQGNWTFDYSDSLIRMLPERFFYDYAFAIALGSLASGALFAIAGHLLWRRSIADVDTAAVQPRPHDVAQG